MKGWSEADLRRVIQQLENVGLRNVRIDKNTGRVTGELPK